MRKTIQTTLFEFEGQKFAILNSRQDIDGTTYTIQYANGPNAGEMDIVTQDVVDQSTLTEGSVTINV